MDSTMSSLAYTDQINEDISVIEEFVPDSHERDHMIQVLRWSIEKLYGCDHKMEHVFDNQFKCTHCDYSEIRVSP